MSHPVQNTIEIVALTVVGWTSFFVLVPWAQYIPVVGQICGIVAALTTTALGLRRIYLSFISKKYKDD